MRKRLLACFLAFAMVLGMMPAAAISTHAEEATVTPPFTSITTEDGQAVTYSYKGAIPAATSWASYEDGPYYHVTIPEGTESVLVTYPADVGIAGAPSAYSYTLSVPEYELGYGSAYFTVVTNDDGSHTVTIPVADYLLTDGTGTAMSLEAESTFDPITFFSFAYAEDSGSGEPEEAREVTASGTCGDDLTWQLFDDGTLEISGTGAMTDFSSTGMPWKNYREQITTVILPEGLTSIGTYAFSNCKVLADVNIPNTVETIGNLAFNYCYEVTELTIPESVTTIGNSAFYYCTGLTELVIPNSVTTVGNSAFSCCSKLEKITLPTGLEKIESSTFYKCEALASIEIPASVTSIGQNAFAYTALTEIEIGDTVTNIDTGAFSYNSKLEKATLGKGLAKVANSLFYNCTALTEVILPDTITEIGSNAFQYTGLTEFTVGDSVKTIGSAAFRDITSLKSVVLGKNVSSIGNYAFRDCTSLAEITFQGSAPTLSSNVFKGITATAYCPCSWKDSTCTATYGSATALTWVKTHTYEGGACTVCGEAEPEAAVNALSAMSFHSTYSAKDTDYVLVPAFDPAVKEYTLVAHDSKNACYAKATLAEGVEGTITAAWVNRNNETEKTQAITSGQTNGQFMAGAVKTGNYTNTVVVTVTDGDDNVIDTYTVSIVRTPSLTGLGLEGMKLNETFLSTTTAYTAATAADSVTVAATPGDESYTVTVNGKEDTTVALEMGENVITVVVKNEDGYETAYTITVTRKESISVSFEVNAENPRITLKDANKTAIVPVDGVYTLISGETYSYTVQCDGYIGQTNSFTLEESGTIEIVLDEATENPDLDKTIYAQWANFRNGPNHLGITSAATPYDPEDAELLWAVKHGTGWSAAPGSPIIVDGSIITYIGSTIKRLDRNTGAVLAEGTMVGSSSYSIVPATYADGMIFVGLSGGRIQCFNAKTLESLWVYTDELGGQPNCPITYKDGYIYAGFWNSETKDANFVCIYTIDEDHENTTEAKLASWTYTRAGGFYWAGAYVSDKFAVVGTDDGASGYTTEGASLLVFDRLTGELVASRNNIRGDIRSNVSYDPSSDRVFFTSKGGILCNAKVDWTTGEISSFNQVTLRDANNAEYAMSTCTPSVYNDRIYIGVCGASQFGDNSGHAIAVYDLNADGSMTLAYTYAIKGYPQTSAMVTTAYADTQEGYVYIYLPYNSTPGGISVLKDKKGQTAPLTTTDSGYSEVFTPVTPLSQYCICSTVADEYGTIYYKNDSCYMMAITSRIEALELTGTPSDTGFKAETRQHNGTTRDVTSYVDITQDTDAGTYAVSYTYGFDNENYGLKTLTVYSVTLPEGEGYTVTGDATAAGGESYTFALNVLATYEKTDAFAVKVNGETLTANEDGTYTVEEVSESLIITVEGVEAKTIEITVYYADNGTIVVGDDADKTLLNFAPVTVTDANGDGQFTMYDGFYCFHEQYHANGAAGYTDSNWVTQFWSVDTAMVSYGKNNRWVFSTADEITDGDSLCLYTYQDQLSWSDLYTYFDNLTATATVNEEASFHVNGYSFFGSGSNMDAIANPVGATVTATCGDKTLTTTTDDEGNFKFTFPSAGEWTILVNGKCSYTCDVGYYQGQTYTDAPVTPAMMTVTVEEPPYVAPDPIEVYMYYAIRGTGIVAGKDGTLLNYVPLTVTDADKDGVLTMSDAFYALHEAYYEGGAAAGYTLGKYTVTFWGKNLSYGQYERNGSNDNVFPETAIENGDMLAVLGGYGYNSLWTHFENGMAGLTATATAGEATRFHVTAYQANGAVGNVTLPQGATVTATCGDTTLTTTVDANGDFTLTFPTAGEYSVLVDGTSEVNGVKCSVIPALMTVTVEAPTYDVTLPEDESYTVSPATGYTTSVKEGENFKFFVTTAVGYQKGENFTVKANGETLTPNGTVYTLENVTTNVTITVEGVEAIVCEPVTVYFSISEDDQFQVGKESGEVMALRKITVPYFDLGLYGLEDFYFSSETYGSDGGAHSSDLLPGTPEYAYGKVTLLHLYIYALEVYYCGIDESLAGQGYLYEQGLLGTEVLNISGSAGSIFMNDFWGMDLNLNYYVNYEYPLASSSWGSTADQILLRENDVITVGHFTSWSFFDDPDSIFNYLTPDEDNEVYGSTTVTQGDKLTLTGYHAGADMSGDYTTAHTKLTSEPTIYYALYDDVEQDYDQWTVLGNLSADGTIVFDTTNLAPGTYVVAMAGMYGSEYTDDICSTPGGILVVVEEKDTIPGDLNGDGKITTVDASMVQMYLKGKTTLTEEQLAAADVNGDGKVTAVDFALMKMYIQNKLESFPKAQ